MAGRYSLALAAFAKKAGDKADAVVRKVVLEIGTRLVERSPVGDGTLWEHPPPKGYTGGRFRANWQYGNFQGAGIPVEQQFEKSPPASSYPGAEQTIAAIETKLPTEGAAGMRHVLINNLPYAQRLEDGWSTQAPSGMVGLAIAEYQTIVNQAASDEKAKG